MTVSAFTSGTPELIDSEKSLQGESLIPSGGQRYYRKVVLRINAVWMYSESPQWNIMGLI